MNDCIFCKIANKTIPAKFLYEDDSVVVFPDIAPQSALHLLVIPKMHIANLAEVTDEHQMLLGNMLKIANRLAVDNGSPDGCRVIINNREIGQQEVQHLHMHILGGNKPLGRMLPPSH